MNSGIFYSMRKQYKDNDLKENIKKLIRIGFVSASASYKKKRINIIRLFVLNKN